MTVGNLKQRDMLCSDCIILIPKFRDDQPDSSELKKKESYMYTEPFLRFHLDPDWTALH